MHPTPRRVGCRAADANSAACPSPHCIGLRSPTRSQSSRKSDRPGGCRRIPVRPPRGYSQRPTGMAACLPMEKILRVGHRLPPPRNLSVPTWPIVPYPSTPSEWVRNLCLSKFSACIPRCVAADIGSSRASPIGHQGQVLTRVQPASEFDAAEDSVAVPEFSGSGVD